MSVLKYQDKMDIYSLSEGMVIGQAITRLLMKRMNDDPEFRRKLGIAEQALKVGSPGKAFRLGKMYVKQVVNDAVTRADERMQKKQEEITNKKSNERAKQNVKKMAN